MNLTWWDNRISKLVSQQSKSDPGEDCWAWIQKYRAKEWEAHLQARREFDQLFKDGKDRQLTVKFKEIYQGYNALVHMWQERGNQCTQAELLD